MSSANPADPDLHTLPRTAIAEELIRMLLHRVEENTAINQAVAAQVQREADAREAMGASNDERQADAVRIHATLEASLVYQRELLSRLELKITSMDYRIFGGSKADPCLLTLVAEHERELAQTKSWRVWWRGIAAGVLVAYLCWVGATMWAKWWGPPVLAPPHHDGAVPGKGDGR